MNLIQEMLRDVVGRGVTYDDALRALRSFARYYGGQHIYIPVHTDTDFAEEIRGVLSDGAGDSIAERVFEVMADFYGGVQHYVPLETRAFKRQIAHEVYTAYDGTQECMRELCRKYNCSLTQIYRLWHAGKNTGEIQEAELDDLQQSFDF